MFHPYQDEWASSSRRIFSSTPSKWRTVGTACGQGPNGTIGLSGPLKTCQAGLAN